MTNQCLETTEPVKVIEVETLDDDALILPIAMMGAPTVMMEKFPSGNEFTQLVSMMEKLMQKKVSAILCIEAGGLNSTIPFVAAAKLGLPIIDGDAMGRAFPELQMVSFTLGGITATPMAMIDDKGNGATFDTISNQWTEKLARALTTTSENREYAIKPMNCPCHIQVFNQGLKSYRDLPIRLAEFGSCLRNEPSGSLHGLMRVRNFVQDDAHIFCTESQVQEEVSKFIDLVFEIYRSFGFDSVLIKLSTRPEKRVGSDEVWDKSEKALSDALDAKDLQWDLLPGEGAFYGPKIEFSLKDCLGRVWQCGTIQVDFSMPERLNASYIDEDSQRRTPVMLHRAILGSFERFVGILIEHYAGRFPVWLAPVQIVVMGITDRNAKTCQEICNQLSTQGYRVDVDLRSEKVGFKVREHTLQRVPFLLIIGDKEQENGEVSVRTREGKDLGSMPLEGFISLLNSAISLRGRIEENDK